MICWVRSATSTASSVGRASASSVRVGVQALGAAEHRGQRLERHAHDVVLRLLRGQRRAAGLGVEAQLPALAVFGAEPLAHDLRPQPPRGAELGDLFEEVVVGVEEEGELRREVVDCQPGVDRRLHVGDGVGQGEARPPARPCCRPRGCGSR